MHKPTRNLNRFGKEIITNIPVDAPMVPNAGHRLRTSTQVVDRKKVMPHSVNKLAQPLDSKSLTMRQGQSMEFVEFEDEVGIIRKDKNISEKTVDEKPNTFTGPSYRNKPERFRFDGHKMLHHLDRIAAWQNGERFAPIHIDMGLTKFCNTACLYCYAVIQNMSKGTMIGQDSLLRFIEDCGRLEVRSIGFIGDGEPTLNPAVYDAAVLAGKQGIDLSMATNGILLDMDRAHDLLKNMAV